MNGIIQFGEEVEGYSIRVLNEREIRAAAGILFLLMFISIMLIMFTHSFVMFKYMITVFLTDMLIRVFVNPRYAPTLIIGRMIVRNQTPEYVGAQQKKFAWIIGVTLATIIFLLNVVVNAYSPITGLICLVCLIFLFFESAFGICLGCKFYSLFYKEKAQYCPGEVCDPKARQAIQKISGSQVMIVLGFVLYIAVVVWVANDFYSQPSRDLLGIDTPATN